MKTKTPHWEPDGKYAIPVVGTSFYENAIEEVARNPVGVGALAFCTARLLLEDDNPQDPKAVAISIGTRKVGHLSREFAPQFRDALSTARPGCRETTADAAISNGLKTQDRQYSYTIDLDIDANLNLASVTEPAFPDVLRVNGYPPLKAQSDGTYSATVWLPVSSHDELHKRRSVTIWTTDHWPVVCFYADNRQRIGLAYKILEIKKSEYAELFRGCDPAATLEALNGRIATLRVRPAN